MKNRIFPVFALNNQWMEWLDYLSKKVFEEIIKTEVKISVNRWTILSTAAFYPDVAE